MRKWRAELETRKAATKTGTLSRATVQRAYRLLKRILTVAVEDGHLHTNPCREKFTESQQKMYCPTAAEVKGPRASWPGSRQPCGSGARTRQAPSACTSQGWSTARVGRLTSTTWLASGSATLIQSVPNRRT